MSKTFKHVLEYPELINQIKQELKNKILGCWCHPKACHGDTLALIANHPNLELDYDIIWTELLWHDSEDAVCKKCGSIITLVDNLSQFYCENGHLCD